METREGSAVYISTRTENSRVRSHLTCIVFKSALAFSGRTRNYAYGSLSFIGEAERFIESKVDSGKQRVFFRRCRRLYEVLDYPTSNVVIGIVIDFLRLPRVLRSESPEMVRYCLNFKLDAIKSEGDHNVRSVA